MVDNDEDHDRSRRPSAEDQGWSHRSNTRWPDDRCTWHMAPSPLAFSLYSPKSLFSTCYTSLYLLNYAYHCARMSGNEM
jgi:hypothetical protein